MNRYIIYLYDIQRNAWVEIPGPVRSGNIWFADDPGSAFKMAVMGDERVVVGEYRVLPLDGGAHLEVSLELTDLDYKSPV